MGSAKQKWKISFNKKSTLKQKNQLISFPKEFICPISGSLMADPVIISSGHTFENNCILACKNLNFTPILHDGSIPNFSTTISNLALKSAILNWCFSLNIDPPIPLDFASAQKLVKSFMAVQVGYGAGEMSKVDKLFPIDPQLDISTSFNSNSMLSIIRQVGSGDGEMCGDGTTTLSKLERLFPIDPRLDITTSSCEEEYVGPTRPFCSYSSSSSSEMETNNFCQEDEIIVKLKSSHVFEQEEAVILLRKLTKTREETRFRLCTSRLLSALRFVMTLRYASLQVNAIAAIVNLSLENRNKVKIVRSGIVPVLIDVLKRGFFESQEHAAGALFSLALDDQNKTAIGVLGALPPLLHSLRSEYSERTRHDCSLALYHLSLVQSNRAKLVKLGAVQSMLGMVRTGHMTGRIMLILCNMAASLEGRGAMLDGGAVECFVGMLRTGEFDSESIRESCVTALYGLSHGGLRFKGLAREAAAEEMLIKLEELLGSERAKDKVKKILEVLREKDEEEEEIDWEELLNSDDDDDDISQTRSG